MTSARLPVAILAGGLGTRLQPLYPDLPKALVEVHGQPFIVHQLRWLRNNGVGQVVICAGHLGELIEQAVGNGDAHELCVRYSFDGDTLLGTGGALKKALPLLGSRFFVLYGDAYLRCDLEPVQRAFETSGRPGLMTVYKNAGRWDASNVELRNGQIVAYDKQQRTNQMRHIDYGLGVLDQHALDCVLPEEPRGLERVYQHLLSEGQLAVFEAKERFYEIGSPGGLKDTKAYFSGRD